MEATRGKKIGSSCDDGIFGYSGSPQGYYGNLICHKALEIEHEGVCRTSAFFTIYCGYDKEK